MNSSSQKSVALLAALTICAIALGAIAENSKSTAKVKAAEEAALTIKTKSSPHRLGASNTSSTTSTSTGTSACCAEKGLLKSVK